MPGNLRRAFKANESLLNRFLLLIAGGSAGVTGGLLVRDPIPLATTIVAASIFIVFSTIGFAIPWRLWDALSALRRYASRKRVIRLGILSDLGMDSMDSTNSAWASLTPREWLDMARRSSNGHPRVLPRLIISRSQLMRYHCILNPYGGVFPEENTATQTTVGRILNYVANGGMVVNVADLPTYFLFDPQLHSKIDATPLIYTSNEPKRPFTETPMLQRLSLYAVNIGTTDKSSWTYIGKSALGVSDAEASGFVANRAVVIEKNVKPVITINIPGIPMPVTPLFYVPFGKGRFLFSMYWFGVDYPMNLPLSRRIIDLIRQRAIL